MPVEGSVRMMGFWMEEVLRIGRWERAVLEPLGGEFRKNERKKEKKGQGL